MGTAWRILVQTNVVKQITLDEPGNFLLFSELIGNSEFFQCRIQLIHGLRLLEFSADFDLNLHAVSMGEAGEDFQAEQIPLFPLQLPLPN
jgi:hypothetical protein